MEKKSRLLLAVEVNDDGIMTFEGTNVVVSGRPIGEPTVIGTISDPDFSGEDTFSYRARIINERAPFKANAYSPGRSWEDNDSQDSPFYRMHLNDECTHYYQAIQYMILDDASLEEARKLIF